MNISLIFLILFSALILLLSGKSEGFNGGYFGSVLRRNKGPVRSHPAALPQQSSQPAVDERIQFPGEQSQVQVFRTRETPSCNNHQTIITRSGAQPSANNICVEDSEYTADIEKRFEELLKKSTYMTEVINNDILVDDLQTGVSTRFNPGLFSSEITVCPAKETIIFPKRGMNERNDWVFILNQPKMKQGVRVEICLFENDECRAGGPSLPRTACRQKYIYRKLLTMDGRGTSIVPETVLIPSCCVCYVSRDFTIPRILPQNPGK